MDVVKHGKYHINEYRMKCWNCGCVYDYAKTDLHNYCGLGEKIYVNCPECNRWNNKNKNGVRKPV